MKKIVLTLILGTFLGSVYAQSGKLKRADDFYQKVAYYQAADLYVDLLGSDLDSPELKEKLADCYYQIGLTEKAEEYYEVLVSSNEASAISVYQYAQVLKENGKYEESDKWMHHFTELSPDDSRGRQFLENKLYLENIKSQDSYFTLRNLSINTDQADFGGYSNDSIAYFISSRRKRISVQRFHTWNNENFLDIFHAEIATNGELENVSFQKSSVNKKFHEGPLCFTPNGERVYFTRNNMSRGKNRKDNKGIQNLKMYTARIGEDGIWIDEEEVSLNSQNYSVGHPTISLDGGTLYFSSDMPGGFGGADIYKVSIDKNGIIGKPENLGANINSEGQEMFPWINGEGLLFFASDGHIGLGGLDVFVALPKQDGSFNKLLNVGEPVNSAKDDFALIMNPDNLTGYVSSNRVGGSGRDDIYAFTLIKALQVNILVEGVVKDRRSNEILPRAKVDLLNKSGEIISSRVTDHKGGFLFDLEPELDYQIVVSKDGYFGNEASFSTKNLPEGTEELVNNMDLEKKPDLVLMAMVTDSKTNEPLQGVTMHIIDNMTGEVFASVKTTESGNFLKGLANKHLEDRLSYNIQLNKEGYFSKTVTFNHQIDKEGVIEIHTLLNGGLTLDKEVKDLTELVKINPINFDLNKSNIRSDAAIELDKIVNIMNKYPLMVVELGAHTDCRGSKAYNWRLSDRRAKASADYIKSKISNPERIYGKGYGETRLLNNCACEGVVKSDCGEEMHSENRRTEFLVISTGSDDVKVSNSSSNSFFK